MHTKFDSNTDGHHKVHDRNCIKLNLQDCHYSLQDSPWIRGQKHETDYDNMKHVTSWYRKERYFAYKLIR